MYNKIFEGGGRQYSGFACPLTILFATFVALFFTGCPHKTGRISMPTVLPISMKKGDEIKTLLHGTVLKAKTEATAFKASSTPAPEGAITVTFSEADSETACIAWFDDSSKTIYYYAKGYTDFLQKIPLNADSSNMFSQCLSLKHIDVSGFDTSNVTSMNCMFYACVAVTNIDISNFDFSSVEDIGCMFQSCTVLETIFAKAGTDLSTKTDITTSGYMFNACPALKGGAGTKYDSGNPHDKSYARIDGGTGKEGYFTQW
ncbi:MAG: BspA family leucine-rich repeat surface protein [Treponema sp.]|nr:BspA family leucine-rich repeat surface protein [Treponema sp.]